jgi:hypothetical protein
MVLSMSDTELRKIIDKLHRLRELNRARAHVRDLERKLYDEPARPLHAAVAEPVSKSGGHLDPLSVCANALAAVG